MRLTTPWRWLLCAALLLGSSLAQAHKASDAYLQIDATAQGLSLRWDIALRDLDAALDLDADADGRLTWAEVKAARPAIERYAMDHIAIDGCPLRAGEQALERRSDGAYAVLFFTSTCVLSQAPQIRYSLLREVDPTHRGIAKLQRAGQAVAVVLLDPTRAPAVTDGTASAASLPAVQAAAPSGWAFVQDGVHHIVTGYDHVLFLLCLLLPSVMRRTPGGWRPVERLSQAVWPVVGIVSAFTVAHSITLGLAATKVISLSPALIEPLIAVTIVLAALDNLWPIFPVPRVAVTFFFGLIHGFGFANVLAELNLPAAEFVWALLQFNAGLEAGQLLIVAGVTAGLFLLRGQSRYPAWVIRGGSAGALLVGALWLIERTAHVSLLPI